MALRGIVEGAESGPHSTVFPLRTDCADLSATVRISRISRQGEAREMKEVFRGLESAFPAGNSVERPVGIAFEGFRSGSALFRFFHFDRSWRERGVRELSEAALSCTVPVLSGGDFFRFRPPSRLCVQQACRMRTAGDVTERLPHGGEETAWMAFFLCLACCREYEESSDFRPLLT